MGEYTRRLRVLLSHFDRQIMLFPLGVSGHQRGTIAKSMYEEHLCVVALTSIERGTQFFPLASYFSLCDLPLLFFVCLLTGE